MDLVTAIGLMALTIVAFWRTTHLYFLSDDFVLLKYARSLHGAFWPLFAAVMFAIHGTRPEAAVWIAGRCDLISTFFVLCGLLLFIRSQNELPSVGYVYGFASLACMILAILTKESAYVFPFLLVLLLVSDGHWSWRRLTGLIS